MGKTLAARVVARFFSGPEISWHKGTKALSHRSRGYERSAPGETAAVAAHNAFRAAELGSVLR